MSRVIPGALVVLILTAAVRAQSPVGPEGERTEAADSICGRSRPVLTGVDVRPRLGSAPPLPITPHGAGTPCTSAGFAALSGTALVNAIATADSCLNVLWSFDADVGTVIAPANVTLVANAVTAEAATLAANEDRVRQLMYFFQIAFYHEFYQASVSYGPTTFQDAQTSLAAVSASPDFLMAGTTLSRMRAQWATSVDSANGTHLVIADVEDVLERFRLDPTLATDYWERSCIFSCFSSIARQIYNQNLALGSGSPWYSLITATMLDAMDDYALDTLYTSDTEPLTNNAIFALGHCSYLDAPTSAAAHGILSSAYTLFMLPEGPWIRTLIDLELFFGAALADGTPLDMVQLRASVAAVALPSTFTFDQGRLTFRTAVPLTTVEGLYDAMKEVQAQFFRKCGFVDPVPGDTGENLTLVIYGSPGDYAKYQPFLYGYGTNNGGIYIEGITTLFTYERTPQQSVFTLEELLRHEFVHYLDARYLVTGGFYGSGTLYQGGRLDWYGEGLAEYLVGSTRTQGVLPRRTLIQDIANDTTRLSVADVIASTYADGFVFYPYAGALMKFLEAQEPDHLRTLFDRVRGDDAAQLDAFFASLSGDPVLAADFDAWLVQRIADEMTGQGTWAEDVPTVPTPTGLPENNADVLRQLLDAQTATGDFGVWSNRFTHGHSLSLPTGGASGAAVRALFDTEMDVLLGQLAPQGLNFASATAWFGEVSIAGGTATADVVVEGPYLATANDTIAPVPPSGLTGTNASGATTLSWTGSPDADLCGYLVYRRELPGGTFAPLTALPIQATSWLDGNRVLGTTYSYRVTALDVVGNESAPSGTVQVTASGGVLVVNGYFSAGNSGYVGAWAAELTARGVAFEIWDPFVDGEVTASVLAPYVDGVVIWAVGYYHSGFPAQFSAVRRAAVTSYLDAGGRFVFSGAFKSLYLQSDPLFTSYFHASHVKFGVDLASLDSTAGSDLLGASLTSTFGGYQSEVDVTAPARPAFTYVPGSGAGSVQSSGTAVFTVDDGYRVVYLAFPFADLDGPSRTLLAGRIMDWVLPGPEPNLRRAVDRTTPPALSGRVR